MRFQPNISEIKTKELIQAEQSLDASVALMAKCAVDATGAEIPPDEARAMLEDMSLQDLLEVQEDFLAAFARLTRKKIR